MLFWCFTRRTRLPQLEATSIFNLLYHGPAQPSSSSSRIGGTVIVIKPKGRKEIDKYKFRINSISATFSRFVMDFIVHKNPREIIFPSILTIVLNPIKSLKKKKQQTNQFDFCFSIIKLSVSPRFDSIRRERIEQIWRI